MLSLFFKRKLKFDLSQSLAQEHFYTFSQRKVTFQTFLHIFKPKNNFSQRKQHFHIQRRPKCYSDIPRTPSPMSSHWLHCQEYRDNVYIFMYTLYLYALCVSRPDTPNTVPFSVYAPLARFTYTFNSPIRIRITYTFNVDAPLACPFNPLYLYV